MNHKTDGQLGAQTLGTMTNPTRRCSCPCPAPLPAENTWPDFSIGTWSSHNKTSQQYAPEFDYPTPHQHTIPTTTRPFYTSSKLYGSNDSGLFSTSPISTGSSDQAVSVQSNFSYPDLKENFVANCDIIADTLNRLSFQETPANQIYPTQQGLPSEPVVVPPRFARWANIATELESWEKRMSAGWSAGQIPRGQLNSFVEFLKRLRQVVRRKSEEGLDLCAFCRNNGEPFEVYISHKVRNTAGQVTCPILRLLSCPLCKSTGDQAHTIKYCPYRKRIKATN